MIIEYSNLQVKDIPNINKGSTFKNKYFLLSKMNISRVNNINPLGEMLCKVTIEVSDKRKDRYDFHNFLPLIKCLEDYNIRPSHLNYLVMEKGYNSNLSKMEVNVRIELENSKLTKEWNKVDIEPKEKYIAKFNMPTTFNTTYFTMLNKVKHGIDVLTAEENVPDDHFIEYLEVEFMDIPRTEMVGIEKHKENNGR